MSAAGLPMLCRSQVCLCEVSNPHAPLTQNTKFIPHTYAHPLARETRLRPLRVLSSPFSSTTTRRRCWRINILRLSLCKRGSMPVEQSRAYLLHVVLCRLTEQLLLVYINTSVASEEYSRVQKMENIVYIGIIV